MTESTSSGLPGSSSSILLNCWECKAGLGPEADGARHFCRECGKLQPLPSGSDYFDFFGLPRKLALNESLLEKVFHEMSWKFHPDRFHNSGNFERELSQELTAVLNDAYRTLRDPVKRAEYLLRLEGVRKEGEVRQQAPPDLLEEVFELNEQLENLRGAKRSGGDRRALADLRHSLEKARASFETKMSEVTEDLAAAFERWDRFVEDGPADGAADREEALNRLNEILNRHNYIRNLVENVADELER